MQEQAQRFQTLIKALKTNQLQLSKKIGVPYSQTNGIFHGKQGISSGYIKKLSAKYPDINITWLMTGKGEVFLPPDETGSDSLLMEPGQSYEKSINPVQVSPFDSDDELRKRLGSNMSRLISAWEMKKYQLFEILMPGVAKQSVTNYLNGSSQVPLYALIRLERISGIPIIEWITRDMQGGDFPSEPQQRSKRFDMVINELNSLIKKLGG